MSDFKRPVSGDLRPDELSDRLKESLSCDFNKPDSKDHLDLGSPVSPLRTRHAGPSTTTATSSSSSSSGSISGRHAANSHPASKGRSHSGELSCGSTDTSPTTRPIRRPGHVRSNSCGSVGTHPSPLIYSGGGSGSITSPPVNVLPTGNICPSGRILKTAMTARQPARADVLGSGTGNYGHGSIMRGGSGASRETSYGNVKGNVIGGGGDPVHRAMTSSDPEDLKRAGNEHYRRGNFAEALSLYDRAIAISPANAAYRSNRAAALTGLGRVAEAAIECEEAVRLDPQYTRAHQRLGSLLIRLGQVEAAKKHLCLPGNLPDAYELQKLQDVEKHLNRCTDTRKMEDWKSTLREADATIAAGADCSPQLYSCRAESLLKLKQLVEAYSVLSKLPKTGPSPHCCSQGNFFGMLSEAYLFYVRAQVEMSLGKFENAIFSAEKAAQFDTRSIEIASLLKIVKVVARARTRGNDLFRSDRFTEACAAYGEGLKLDPCNSVLYCNRAVCWSKLGMWERSIEDCNHALQIQPGYAKALLRRAASNYKLERWNEAVSDYEVLCLQLPDDKQVAESLFHAQVALMKSQGKDVSNMKFGGEVEEVVGLDQFKAATSSPGVSVVSFKVASNEYCRQISGVIETLCGRYPSVNFFKVDLEQSPDIADADNVRIVPTLKIYKNGNRVKEVVNPTSEGLEALVRHYMC